MKQRLIDANELMKLIPAEEMVSKLAIANAPTVEAIPYEFLRELAKNQPHYILTVWDFLPRVIENIIEVWEDWVKENEIDRCREVKRI